MPPDEPGPARTQTAAEIATTFGTLGDPELADLVAAWPDLPEAIKSGIMPMVKASQRRRSVDHD